jgi:hypothetical protein
LTPIVVIRDGASWFTPAPAKGRPSQVRVAIRAQIVAPTQIRLADASTTTAAVNALTPTGYNLGLAVGWRRFAVSGDVAKVTSVDPAIGGRESAVLGVSYSLKRFTARRGRRRAHDGQSGRSASRGDNYSLDVGGAYSTCRAASP